MKKQFLIFIIRWILCSFALWISIRIVGTNWVSTSGDNYTVFLLAGFLLSVLNSFLMPLLVIISIPALIISFGLFALILNGFMVWMAVNMTPGLEISFWKAVFAGIVVSLVNYILKSVLELKRINE